MYVQEPLALGRRRCMGGGGDLNEETLAAENGC